MPPPPPFFPGVPSRGYSLADFSSSSSSSSAWVCMFGVTELETSCAAPPPPPPPPRLPSTPLLLLAMGCQYGLTFLQKDCLLVQFCSVHAMTEFPRRSRSQERAKIAPIRLQNASKTLQDICSIPTQVMIAAVSLRFSVSHPILISPPRHTNSKTRWQV